MANTCQSMMGPEDTTWSADAVLDALPYGVLVLDASGEVLRANASARELVPGIGTPAVRSCRDLFACRVPGGPCERNCLVERTSRAASAAPEIRIDTAGGTSPGALWVTAAPPPASHDGGARAILHLRPGGRSDRRRRCESRWLTGPELRIRALGRTHVEALDDSLDGQWLGERPGHVLKYLLSNRTRVVAAEEIAEAIWPSSGRRAVGNTRYVIHRLREKLEPRRAAHDSSAFVVAQGGGYALNRERIWIDVDEFEHAVNEGRAAMARVDPAAATRHLEDAVKLYRGDFLADEPYAHWASDERNRLAGMATYALRVAIALAHEGGDVMSAVRHLERLAELEPFDTGVHRELIVALLSEGLRGNAKRRYDSFAERLRREFGEEPGFDLRSLRAARATD